MNEILTGNKYSFNCLYASSRSSFTTTKSKFPGISPKNKIKMHLDQDTFCINVVFTIEFKYNLKQVEKHKNSIYNKKKKYF